MSVGDFLQFESKTSGLFDNEFIQTTQFLENMQVKESAEKITFFKRLPSIMDHLPSNFAKYKLLPVLIHAIEHGSGKRQLPLGERLIGFSGSQNIAHDLATGRKASNRK